MCGGRNSLPLLREDTLARLLKQLSRARAINTRVSRLHARILRGSRGRIRRSWLFAAGQPVMVITTTGRRSGQPRSTVVAYFEHEGGFVTTASNLGSDRHPAWALNLMANPRAIIAVEGQSLEVISRQARGEERAMLWAKWEELQRAAKGVAAVADREIPVFVLEPEGAGRQD
jgi:F420H(2)-dependent quinone reductase